MIKIKLRKLKKSDKEYFARWWRDNDLIALTSGVFKPISDGELKKYFLVMLKSKKDLHFMIIVRKRVIGHISLMKRKNNWFETQIIIGERLYWGKGYGTGAIKLLIKKVKKLGIFKIYLEVRPDNIRAIKAYQKCGFEGTSVKEHPKNKYLPKVLKMQLISSK
jgi:RimJ/RimL family protein N-acetyltransferase